MADKRNLNIISATVDNKVKKWLENEAELRDRPMTYIIREIIEAHIDSTKKPRGRPKKVKKA